MSVEHMILTYGYWALLIGTILEGETFLILAGIAACHNYLTLPWVIVIAVLGSLVGDQFFFFLGRKQGKNFLATRPAWRRRTKRAYKFLEKYDTLALMTFRFFYGLRTVIPFVIGLSKIRTKRFVIINTISAILWSALLGTCSFYFGKSLGAIIERGQMFELKFVFAAVFLFGIGWLIYSKRDKFFRK